MELRFRMGIKEWFKENWAFIGILLFTIGIRIYYFILTNGQPLWWDSAEYLNIARRFAFGEDYSFGPVRPVFMSLIFSLFLRISNTELIPRLFMLFLSIASVVGVYYLGKEIRDKTTGLISALLFSTFYIGLFYTYRLLVDLPSMTFFIFSALFFYKYAKEKKSEFLYFTALLVGIGTLFKLSTAFILAPFLLYLLFTEKIGFIKKKEIWISLGIFIMILLPYVLWGFDEFHGFVLTEASSHVAPSNYLTNLFSNLKSYFHLFNLAVPLTFLILSALGIILLYKPLLYYRRMREGNQTLRGEFYLILLLVLPLLIISTMINHSEDRYIITAFPILFLVIANGINKLYWFGREHNRIGPIILLVVILIFLTISQFKYSDELIKSKIGSYADVKQAGLWLKENSQPGDIIVTKSQPQIRYYSERRTIGLPKTEEEFEASLTPATKFYMISIFEAHQQWQYDYPKEKNLTLAQAYITQDGSPLLIIYNLK